MLWGYVGRGKEVGSRGIAVVGGGDGSAGHRHGTEDVVDLGRCARRCAVPMNDVRAG
jgi:hypothetical protein